MGGKEKVTARVWCGGSKLAGGGKLRLLLHFISGRRWVGPTCEPTTRTPDGHPTLHTSMDIHCIATARVKCGDSMVEGGNEFWVLFGLTCLGEGGWVPLVSPPPGLQMATPLCTTSWVDKKRSQPEFGVVTPRWGVGVNPLCCFGSIWLENAQVHTTNPPSGLHTSTPLCTRSWVSKRGPQPEVCMQTPRWVV